MSDPRKRDYLRRVRRVHEDARGLADGSLKQWDTAYFRSTVMEWLHEPGAAFGPPLDYFDPDSLVIVSV